MRKVAFLVIVGAALGCGGKAAAPAPEPYRRSDAAEAFAAHQAYCSLCPEAETCCLTEADFSEQRWSSASGRYLRTMRDYYACQRAATLLTLESSREDPQVPSDSFRLTGSNVRASCFPHSCGDLGETMAAELDRALAKPAAHSEGALVVCSTAAAVTQ